MKSTKARVTKVDRVSVNARVLDGRLKGRTYTFIRGSVNGPPDVVEGETVRFNWHSSTSMALPFIAKLK